MRESLNMYYKKMFLNGKVLEKLHKLWGLKLIKIRAFLPEVMILKENLI